MTTPAPLGSNFFQDLSGVDTSAFSNPYDALIHASNNDPVNIHPKTQNSHLNTKIRKNSKNATTRTEQPEMPNRNKNFSLQTSQAS
jgi:hypothetical protein